MADMGSSSTVSAGATSATVFQPRFGRRIAVTISNVGANIVYLNFSDAEGAATSYGIALQPGTSFGDSSSDYVKCWQGRITCISAAGSTLACYERCYI